MNRCCLAMQFLGLRMLFLSPLTQASFLPGLDRGLALTRTTPSSVGSTRPAHAVASAAVESIAHSVTQQKQVNEEMHTREVARGWERFGRVRPGMSSRRSFADGDFESQAATRGCAGPDEAVLRDGHRIHASLAPVISAAECAAVVAEARVAMESGKTSTFTYTAASRISEVHVSQLPRARRWLSERLGDTFWPLLESRFGEREGSSGGKVVNSSELAVYDALIIKYDASRGGTRQPTHRDAALISMNIALNSADEYSDGGTYFQPMAKVLTLDQGHCLCHASGMRHAGYPITSGERWVLVIFALAQGAVQHARRCGERGVESRQKGELAAAKAAFLAGIASSPTDHELHHGLASVLTMEGDFPKARASLRTACSLYPYCPKPHNGLGALLLESSRPRAALRAYERAIALSVDPDDDDGWDAAVNSALCALMLAERDASRNAGPARTRWQQQMAQARARIWLALVSVPSDRRLHALLARTQAVSPLEPTELPEIRKVIKEAVVRQRLRLGSAMVRSWDASIDRGSSPKAGGTLVIAFAGADAALGAQVKNGVPSHEFVRACRKAGVERAIFVRDVMRSWYLRGIGRPDVPADVSDAGGSFEEMVELLRAEVRRARPDRLVTIGSSMGGYAAVRAGIALGADHVVAFAPQVVIDPRAREALQLPEMPFTPFLEGLQAFGEIEQFELLGLLDVVRTASGYNTVVEVHVGSKDVSDVREAMLLQEAVQELVVAREDQESLAVHCGQRSDVQTVTRQGGVTCSVVVHDERDHNLVVDMRDSGELHDLLCRVASSRHGTSDAKDADSLPDKFLGFHDCPDF
ncbi:hypothetical protein AB1Y20_019984 [Prymnesium parvum]|uniref:Prolyl 4-hydroxylase alpha subunit domain-containing protein n=1 Tax=Prymnesium parvum TaxID=97485 RepID=A0AB34JVK7_PRYPA